MLEHERAHLTAGTTCSSASPASTGRACPALLGAREFDRAVHLLVELAADDARRPRLRTRDAGGGAAARGGAGGERVGGDPRRAPRGPRLRAAGAGRPTALRSPALYKL